MAFLLVIQRFPNFFPMKHGQWTNDMEKNSTHSHAIPKNGLFTGKV